MHCAIVCDCDCAYCGCYSMLPSSSSRLFKDYSSRHVLDALGLNASGTSRFLVTLVRNVWMYGTHEDVTHRDTMTLSWEAWQIAPYKSCQSSRGYAVWIWAVVDNWRRELLDPRSSSGLCPRNLHTSTLRSCVHVVKFGFVAGRGVCFQGWRMKHGEMFSAKQPVGIMTWCAWSPDRNFRRYLL